MRDKYEVVDFERCLTILLESLGLNKSREIKESRRGNSGKTKGVPERHDVLIVKHI